MLDASIAMVHYHFSYFDASGTVLPRVGSEHHNMVPYGTFRCRDGHLAIAAVPEPPKFFVELCDCLGHPEWVHDPRFDTADARRVHREALKAAMEAVLMTASKAEWFERLSARGVPVAPVNELSDLPNDAQVLARDMLVSLTSPESGTIRLPGSPIKMRGARPVDEWTAPPLLGSGGSAAWPAAPIGDEPFDANLLQRRESGAGWALAAWWCCDCERGALGRAERCPACGSRTGRVAQLRDRGTLETWSRIAGKDGPYIVGYALLEVEGEPGASVRVFGPLRVDDEGELALGMRITVVFEASPIAGAPKIHHAFVPTTEESLDGAR